MKTHDEQAGMTLLSWSRTVLGAAALFFLAFAARIWQPETGISGISTGDLLLAGLLLAVVAVGMAILHHLRRLEG